MPARRCCCRTGTRPARSASWTAGRGTSRCSSAAHCGPSPGTPPRTWSYGGTPAPPATPHITVTTTADPRPALSIVDTGVGVPAEDLPHVFDRFHRSSTADHLASQGAGLGLTIVKAIIEAHHGDITVTSTQGQGTAVRLTLPCPGGSP
ncbi:ATP-binding protein [Dactylosporangium sp. NPDC005555]|uniref:sensor histidine kinase n=1 Tax=Dactylosporangium sp. NPDC005555 TaxID=3154889 RepID=UPI0033B3E1A4